MVEREFVPTKSTSLNVFKGHVVVVMLHLSPTKTPLVVLQLDIYFCVQVNKIGFQKNEQFTSIVYLPWLLLWKSQINSKIQMKGTIHARLVKRMSLNSAENAHVSMHPRIRLDDN